MSAALNANFHSDEARVSSEVLSKLQRVRSAFDGTIPIELDVDGAGAHHLSGRIVVARR